MILDKNKILQAVMGLAGAGIKMAPLSISCYIVI